MAGPVTVYSMLKRSSLLFALALLAGAALLRLAYLAGYSDSPFFHQPVVDAHTFYTKAQAIAAGDWWGENEAFWQPPFYIYWLAGLLILDPEDFFLNARLAQVLFGSLSCLWIYLLGRRTGDESLGRLAGIGTAFYGSALYFEAELLATGLELFFNGALLLSLARAEEGPGRTRFWFGAGVLAGLAALTRPTILAFVLLYPLWWAYRRYCSASPNWRTHLSGPLLFLIALCICIAPVTWRNYQADGDFVLVSSNGGINFYIGNNADYDRTVATRPGMPWEALVAQPLEAGYERAAQRSAFFTAKALDYIANSPLNWAALTLKKTYLLWAAPEIKRNQDPYYARRHSSVLALLLWDFGGFSFPFGLVGPLALVGLAMWRRPPPPIALLRFYLLTYGLAIVLFFPVARYRLPLLPPLLVFASYTLLHFWRNRHKPAQVGKPVLAAAALAVALNLPAPPPLAADAEIEFHLGEVLLRDEDYARSLEHSSRALQLEPTFNYARHNLAVAHFHLDEFAKAAEQARRTLAENPRRVDTLRLLGRIEAAGRDRAAAAAHYRQALDLDPDDAMTHYYYGRLLFKSGRYAAAARHMQQARRAYPDDFWLAYELAQSHQRQKNWDTALDLFAQAYRIEARPAALNAQGVVHFQRGDLARARAFFDRALEAAPADPDASTNRAVIDMEEGRLGQAIIRLQEVLRRHPDFGRAAGALEEAKRRSAGRAGSRSQ